MIRLEEIRKSRGMTQTELSKAAGLSQAFVSDVERGKCLPSVETLVRFARVLDCTLDDLVDVKAAPA